MRTFQVFCSFLLLCVQLNNGFSLPESELSELGIQSKTIKPFIGSGYFKSWQDLYPDPDCCIYTWRSTHNSLAVAALEEGRMIKAVTIWDEVGASETCVANETYGFLGNHVWVSKNCYGGFFVCFTNDRTKVQRESTMLVRLNIDEAGNPAIARFWPGQMIKRVEVKKGTGNGKCEAGSYWFWKDWLTVVNGCQGDHFVTYGLTTDKEKRAPIRKQSHSIFLKSSSYKFYTFSFKGNVTIVGMDLGVKISKAECTKGATYGYLGKDVFVSLGCEAWFNVHFKGGEASETEKRKEVCAHTQLTNGTEQYDSYDDVWPGKRLIRTEPFISAKEKECEESGGTCAPTKIKLCFQNP